MGLVLLLSAIAVGTVTYDVLVHRFLAGTDTASSLAAFLPYLGVDRIYVLARAAGVAALFAAAASVGCGLWTGRLRTAASAPPRWLPAAHRQASLLCLLLTGLHAAVPYLSVFPPYGGWQTAAVPFAQPYSWGTRGTVGESLGILAFWLMGALGPSYYLVRGPRRRVWGALHRAAALVYLLAVVHVLVLGSDVVGDGPVRALFVLAQAPLVALAARRFGSAGSRLPAALFWLLAAGLSVAGVAGLAGLPLGGLS